MRDYGQQTDVSFPQVFADNTETISTTVVLESRSTLRLRADVSFYLIHFFPQMWTRIWPQLRVRWTAGWKKGTKMCCRCVEAEEAFLAFRKWFSFRKVWPAEVLR